MQTTTAPSTQSLNGNRYTITLTGAQLVSLLRAASRGLDEWDMADDNDPFKPKKYVRNSALDAYQIIHEAVYGGNH